MLVLTLPSTHHAVAKLALAAGKHVLVEKPLATRLEDGFNLIQAAEHAGRVLMVSQNYRYNGPFQAAQRLLAEKALGELVSIEYVAVVILVRSSRRATSGTRCAILMSWTCRYIILTSSERRQAGMCAVSTPAAGVSPTVHLFTTRRSRRWWT